MNAINISIIQSFKWSAMALCSIMLHSTLAAQALAHTAITPSGQSEKMKGLCWVGNDSIVSANFQETIDIGANWISLTAFGWMPSHDAPIITTDPDTYWWGQTDAGIKHTAEEAHQAGLAVMLQPHISLPRDRGKWRHDIKMSNDKEWMEWFDNYEEWIMGYARLANESDIEVLCIGTELYKATVMHPERWSTIIAKIRAVYAGKLMYAANWYRELGAISFWGDLDYIGVQAYYPLASSKHPSKKLLTRAWKKRKKKLERLSEKYNKQIVFTEIGYRNTADAAIKPWEWPQDLGESVDISEQTQQVCYEAFFESVWEEPWFDGAFIWNWHHPTYKLDNIADYMIDRSERLQLWASQIGKEINPQLDFSPQQNRAYAVVQKWYGERLHHTSTVE